MLQRPLKKLTRSHSEKPVIMKRLRDFLNETIHEKRAEIYIKLHNAASKEYKKAFAKFGAKMWRDDDAQEISSKNLKDVTNSMALDSNLFSIPRPLTVLNSFPNVTSEQKRMLNKEVDEIHKKYEHLLKNELKKLG